MRLYSSLDARRVYEVASCGAGIIALRTARAERVTDALEGLLGQGHYRGPAGGSVDGAEIVRRRGLENTSRSHTVRARAPGRPLLGYAAALLAATVQPEPER
jgi:hypothetical protein